MTRAPDVPEPTDLAHVQAGAAGLLHVIDTLHWQTLDPAATAVLQTLRHACLATNALPARQAPPVHQQLVDDDVFDRLLALAGPETAQDLLDRLAEDLSSVRQLLDSATSIPDPGLLRQQSHILIGLAGAVGAENLRAHAQTLNDVAHGSTVHDLSPLLSRVSHQLAALIHYVRARRIAPTVSI
jgi:HPt (histidine-containing phosphotransfer) domain-containing protein